MSIEDAAAPGAEGSPTSEPEFIGGVESGVEPSKSEPEAEPEKEPEPEAKAKPEGDDEPEGDKPKQTPWFQKRIDALTHEGREAQRKLDAANAELARLRTPAPVREGEPERKASEPTAADIDRLATEKAQQIAAVREFDKACDGVYADGTKAYPDFDVALSNFKLLGGLPPVLVEAAIETENAARVLYDLGKNPDEAQRIMALPPIKMAAAVARLAAKPAQAAPVSKAPAPIKPISGSGRVELDESKMSMSDWEKKNPLPSRH